MQVYLCPSFACLRTHNRRIKTKRTFLCGLPLYCTCPCPVKTRLRVVPCQCPFPCPLLINAGYRDALNALVSTLKRKLNPWIANFYHFVAKSTHHHSAVPTQPPFYILFRVCKILFCFMFPAKRREGVIFFTNAGKVAPISPGDTVQILDVRDSTVLRVNPHSGSVVLRRVDATPNQRSFLRPSVAIWVLPWTSRDACIMVDETTSNYLCEPTPPPVLPDTKDTGVQCCVDTDDYNAFVTNQFDNIATLARTFNEARKEAFITKWNVFADVPSLWPGPSDLRRFDGPVKKIARGNSRKKR